MYYMQKMCHFFIILLQEKKSYDAWHTITRRKINICHTRGINFNSWNKKKIHKPNRKILSESSLYVARTILQDDNWKPRNKIHTLRITLMFANGTSRYTFTMLLSSLPPPLFIPPPLSPGYRIESNVAHFSRIKRFSFRTRSTVPAHLHIVFWSGAYRFSEHKQNAGNVIIHFPLPIHCVRP